MAQFASKKQRNYSKWQISDQDPATWQLQKNCERLCFGRGALTALTPKHFVGQLLFHSHLIRILRKTWIGWLAWLLALFGGRCQPCCKELEQERAARQASVMNAALFGCWAPTGYLLLLPLAEETAFPQVRCPILFMFFDIPATALQGAWGCTARGCQIWREAYCFKSGFMKCG